MCDMRTQNIICGSNGSILRQMYRIIIIFIFFPTLYFNSSIPYKLNNVYLRVKTVKMVYESKPLCQLQGFGVG